MQVFTTHCTVGNRVTTRFSEILEAHDLNADAWRTLPVETPPIYIDKISAGLNTRTNEIAIVIAREVGKALATQPVLDMTRPTNSTRAIQLKIRN